MGTRGLWNVRVDGKWYRVFHRSTARITSPDAPATLRTVRKVVSETAIENWESIPFPSPLHINLDYVYNIDKDLGVIMVTQWTAISGALYRLIRQAKLAAIEDPSLSTLDDILVDNEDITKQHRTQYTETGLTTSLTLKINIAKPTSLTELQLRLFTDFVSLWRFYFDDLPSWSHDSRFRKTLAIGLLRIAAWDLEILSDTDTEGIPEDIIEEIPIGSYSIPKWSAPSENIFWLLGFLVTVSSASDTLENTPVIHVILTSLGYVTLLEITGTGVQYSPTIPLVINSSAIQPSPGFRALILEKWGINLPTEILDRILRALAPKDVISFARASTAVDRWYYSSLPQLDRVLVRSFDFSIPCCGERHNPNGDGVSCSTCYTWYHSECAGLSSESQECHQNGASKSLEAGAIYRAHRKIRSKPSCKVTVDGEVKVLNLRTAKPAARRPERFLFRGLSIPPNDLNYTIRFNRVFSGLAYGLDEV
ncbi:PHD finger domain-containing protein [Aspergillus brunneoviolaceus CBS 621.78]|uniref:Uncharacterized protein n=1 Tax=Aspergillus brunneoviolaceus CBS 621.78 TaxID=1450534 RepID=A0ACD1FXL6_9EURO|nr:hypothetical protein BO95DRAFT_456401 [Aspergillus brunneoviolaceus CBS 621.78]RAH41700.1 hypothetical protein BO95DRAFT_456401 [Aspergillus brunneoviolaceus CBS 621.78]